MPLRQLSGDEAGFLYSDTAHSNANVSLLHIYDQSTAPGAVVRFKSILAHIERRLHRSPLFRQRLQRVPLGLDHPYWVDDEHFDLEYHVRHIALPKPGDWRQFCIQTSRIHARALDLERPLWEAYVIEGLDSFLDLPEGSFALMLKTHRAAVDLEAMAALTALLHDESAQAPAPAPPAPWFARAAPGWSSLAALAVRRSAAEPMRLASPLLRAASHAGPAAIAVATERLLAPADLPVTRFNSVVSPHRVFETRRFTEAEFDAVRALAPGATVEDAALAVCGGALRRYLDAQDELPSHQSLSAIVPEPRAEGAGDTARKWRQVVLGTDIADPAQRLAALRDARLAQAEDDGGFGFVPAALRSWTRSAIGRAGARIGRNVPPSNCKIVFVPAPPRSQYLCGARMTYYSAMLPISDGLGLSIAVTHYDGRVVVSPTACRELLPDPEAFALCLRDSFQEYLALAAAPRPAGAAGPATAAAPRASAPGRPRRPAPRA